MNLNESSRAPSLYMQHKLKESYVNLFLENYF